MSVTQTPTHLHWYQVPWVSGGLAGTRLVRAPNGRSAEHDLHQHPGDYGLPCESVIVGTAVRSPLSRTGDPEPV